MINIYCRQACAIPDQENEEVIITGGGGTEDVRQKVSVYSDAGWKKDLAPMNVGRALHACGFYVSGGKKVVFLVLMVVVFILNQILL